MISVANNSSLETQQMPAEKISPNNISTTTSDHDHDHVFKSKLPDIAISNNISLHAYCFEKLSKVADRPCLISGSTGKTYTFAETHIITRRFASALSRLGIKKGDVIMILLHNCPEFVFTFMASSMLGAVATTANPCYTATEIFKQITLSNAKLIITQSQYVDKLRENSTNDKIFPVMGQDFKVITTDEPPQDCLHFWALEKSSQASEEEEEEEEEEETLNVDINADEPVALPFSSGTTGLPKGVILTHKSLITSVAQQVDGENPNLNLKKEDVVLCVLPLFHIYSLNSVLLCSLRAGAAVLLMHKFEIVALLELIQKYKVSMAAVVPPLVLALTKNPKVAEYDLSSIRIVLSGAAPLGKELQDALRSRVPQALLGQGYGMTEAGPVISMSLSFAKQPFPSKSGSCGSVVRNAELKVIDPETGSSLGYNQPGEICIRGAQVMKGYLNDDKATAATIDIDGWLYTGDIGYVDDDDEIFIVDRVKELIKFKGFQVPPAELESLLVSHPLIADAAVVPQKDDAAGEVPVAFVVRSTGDLTEEAVKEYIVKQVIFYKKLHKVYFVHAIPKSASGKILRKDLRAKLATASPLT